MSYGWPKTLHKGGETLVVASEAEEVAAIAEGWSHKPTEAPKSSISELRAAYKEKFGKGPSPRWDAATLREKLA